MTAFPTTTGCSLRHVDAVAIVGDLADVVSPGPHERQTVVLSKYLGLLAEPTAVFAASGNHDLDGRAATASRWLAPNPGARDVARGRGQRRRGGHQVHGVPVVGRAGHQGGGRRPARRRAVDRPARWIWLHHAPPAGTPLCNDGRRTFPDQGLADWIAQHRPDIVLCGHIHQAPWIDGGTWHARLGETRVFNAGTQIGKVAAHITLDTEAMTAHWFGVFESETISPA